VKGNSAVVLRTHVFVICLILLALSATAPSQERIARSKKPKGLRQAPEPTQQASVVKGYGQLPLAFEANQGQSGSDVKFVTRGPGYSLFLKASEAMLAMNISDQEIAVVRMKLLNANPNVRVWGASR
jgi:hypothetical protein